jgi:hypothetical protein
VSTPPLTHDRATRFPAGTFALGIYCMLLGVVFYVPFMLSPFAQQNDVFMTNLFLGLLLLVAGSAVIALATTRIAAGKPWLNITLSVLSALVAFAGIIGILSTNSYAAAAPVMAAYTAILLVLSAVVAARQQRLAAWAQALLLALVASAVVTLYYAVLGSQYHDVSGVATYLPRYLDGQTSGLALLLGIAVFFIARLWARRA